MVVLIL